MSRVSLVSSCFQGDSRNELSNGVTASSRFPPYFIEKRRPRICIPEMGYLLSNASSPAVSGRRRLQTADTFAFDGRYNPNTIHATPLRRENRTTIGPRSRLKVDGSRQGEGRVQDRFIPDAIGQRLSRPARTQKEAVRRLKLEGRKRGTMREIKGERERE